MNIKEMIRQIADGKEIYCLAGVVTKVSASAYSCEVEPINGEATLKDVRIKADLDAKTGLAMIPREGTNVVVGFLNKNTAFLVLATDIERIELQCDDIVINKGDNSGLVKVKELTGRLNTLEKDINDLKQVFSTTWVTAPNDGGAALKTAAATWAGQTITETKQTDIENDKIKH